MNIGDTVNFRLDNFWPGTGVVTLVFFGYSEDGSKFVDQYSIRLSSPCKEHPAGTEILVGVEEIC